MVNVLNIFFSFIYLHLLLICLLPIDFPCIIFTIEVSSIQKGICTTGFLALSIVTCFD